MMSERTVGTNGRRVIAIVVALTTMSACGGGQDESAAPVEPMGVDKVAAELAPAQYTPDPTGRVTLPLDAYRDQLSAARGGMTAEAVECFVEVGVPADEVGVQVSQPERHDRRYGVADPGIASRFGYHAPDVKDPRDALLDAADEDQLVAATQCLAELPPPAPEVTEGEQLVTDIQSGAWWAAQEDARVVDAFTQWSECMAAAGYDYQHPMEANDDPQWATPKATAAEITVALADVACKSEVNLIATWSAAEAEQQAALISDHQSELNQYKAALRH